MKILLVSDSHGNNEVLDEQQKTDAMLAIDEAYAQNKKNLWANIAADINGYTEQTADIAQKFGDLMLKNVQTETDLELAKLDEKYEKGEMSEEQYYEKQKAIKRKAAQEEYKIQMFQWNQLFHWQMVILKFLRQYQLLFHKERRYITQLMDQSHVKLQLYI